MEQVNFEDGISYSGNWRRLQRVMEKAKRGEPITVGFLGGSITQGSLSSLPTTCYAHLVYQWWQQRFPQSQVTYVNAGIGGTTSQFGAARVEQDLLSYAPDFVAVEFSVNDDNAPFFRETYEGLVRKILQSNDNLGVLLIHNVCYDTGVNAQDQHELIGRHYQLPCVSMKNSVYRQVAEGKIPNREITPDDLHPNDAGHRLLADLVIYFLEKVVASLESPLPAPITANGYETSVRYRNQDCNPVLEGFEADETPQNHITETFRKGWIGKKVGDKITFQVEASSLAVQYRKSVQQPACIAKVVVDGQEENSVTLDGNFQETWGDCLYLETLLSHGETKKHTLEITVIQGEEGKEVPFYLVAVMGATDIQADREE